MGGLGDFLFGSEDKLKKVETSTPQQRALHNDILAKAMGLSAPGGGYSQAQNYFNSLLQPGNEAFDNFSAPYLQNFEEQILPMIAERFAGGGALSSSGFGQAVGGAGAGLQAQLAQLFESLRSQAAGAQTNQYNQLAQTGLNFQPFGYERKQGSQGMAGPLFGAIGTALGGPIGGALGQGIAGLFKNGGGGLSGATGRAVSGGGLASLLG